MLVLIVIAIVAALGVLLVLTVRLHTAKAEHGTHEVAMTVVMVAGMMVGLTGGVVAGLLLPDDLWVPTLIGSLAGLTAGGVAGRPAGLMAVLEGSMAGVMGGAMGAMMGGMMPARGFSLLVSVVALTVGIGVAASQLVAPRDHEGHHEWALVRPLAFGSLAVLSAGIAAWIVLAPVVHRIPAPRDHHSVWTEVDVVARESKYSVTEMALPLGQPVRLRLINEDQNEHDLTIQGLNYSLPTQRDRRAELPGIHLHTPAGQTQVLEFVPQRAGEFEAYCTIPGHREQGMRIVVRVAGGV